MSRLEELERQCVRAWRRWKIDSARLSLSSARRARKEYAELWEGLPFTPPERPLYGAPHPYRYRQVWAHYMSDAARARHQAFLGEPPLRGATLGSQLAALEYACKAAIWRLQGGGA